MNAMIEQEPTHAVISAEQLNLIKRTIAKDATSEELQLFFYDCRRHGVHPLDKLIHFTKRGGRYVPITSIDFLRMKSAATGCYAGCSDAIFTGTPETPDFTCTMTAYRLVQGIRAEFTASARWSEYCPGPGQDHMWKKMPRVMLAKVTESLVLRKAFAEALHGLYSKEELDQAEPRPTRDLRPLAERLAAQIIPSVEHNDPTPLAEEGLAVATGAQEIEEIDSTQPETAELIPAFIWRLGKHKGESVRTMPSGYLTWAAENVKADDHKAAATEELQRRKLDHPA